MKKYFINILLFIFVFNLLGNYTYLKFEQWIIHEKIEKELAKSDFRESLIKISFLAETVEDINWERKGKELWFKGNLYDVVSVENHGNQVVFLCLNDGLEKQLFEKYWALNTQKSSKPINAATQLILKLIFQTIEDNTPWAFETSTLLEQNLVHIFSKNKFFYNFYLTQISPPPQRIYLS